MSSLGAGGDIGLLAAAPAILFDRLSEFETETGAAAVIDIQHIESAADQVLDLRVEAVLRVHGWAAMNVDHRPPGVRAGAVQPTLDGGPIPR